MAQILKYAANEAYRVIERQLLAEALKRHAMRFLHVGNHASAEHHCRPEWVVEAI
jgi:hypothetical protein